MSGRAGPPARPGDLAAAKADPAPHTWMDLPLSGAGPVATVVIGVLFVGLAAVALGVPLARHDFTRHWEPVVLSTLR